MTQGFSRKTVELFGTVLRETPRAYHFAPEDDETRAFWAAKSIAAWDGVAMHLPFWLARKRRLISPLPDDDHPAWLIILKPTPTFLATSIKPTESA